MATTQRDLATKQMLLQHAIDAKQQMSKWLQSKTETGDYAYALAQDEEIRKMTQILTQKVLNPTPLNSLKYERTNTYIDLGMGISAFWDEIHTNSSIEVENAMILDSVLMNVESGVDENINPNLRRTFLTNAGLSEDQIDTLLSLEVTSEYEQKAQDELYVRICEQFGLDMDDPEQRVTIDNLVQDSLMSQDAPACLDGVVEMNEDAQGQHTYEEMYGVSSAQIYGAFAPDDAYFDSLQFPEYVAEYTMNENNLMYDSMVGFQDMLNATIEDNMAMYADLEQQSQASFNSLSDEDLVALEPQDSMMEQLAFDENDLNFDNESEEYQQ